MGCRDTESVDAFAVSYVFGFQALLKAASTQAAIDYNSCYLCQQKQTMCLPFWLQESSSTYNAAMAATGEALMQAASSVLNQQSQQELDFEGDL